MMYAEHQQKLSLVIGNIAAVIHLHIHVKLNETKLTSKASL